MAGLELLASCLFVELRVQNMLFDKFRFYTVESGHFLEYSFRFEESLLVVEPLWRFRNKEEEYET